MEDRILLTGLHFVGRHGVTDAERAQPQEFRVDIECPVDTRAAAAADSLAATLDYQRLNDCAAAIITGPPRQLVETLADELAARVLAEVGCGWVRARVTKVRPGAIGGAATVEVWRPQLGGLVAPVELHVPAFAPVKTFYGRLGFTVAREETADDGGGYLVLRRGPNLLRFWPGSDRIDRHEFFGAFPRSTRRGYGVEIVIVVDDLDAIYAAAQAFARIVGPLRERPWGLRDFRLEDPFGYYVRVTERHDPLVDPRS